MVVLRVDFYSLASASRSTAAPQRHQDVPKSNTVLLKNGTRNFIKAVSRTVTMHNPVNLFDKSTTIDLTTYLTAQRVCAKSKLRYSQLLITLLQGNEAHSEKVHEATENTKPPLLKVPGVDLLGNDTSKHSILNY
ncbi:unnamed protein product [Schistocephalus solidus]|uniref:Pentatricopeptide repeat-containing protein n=1 Tax=Schistocephalus solidus TaxID=70667 RepID=A0A183SDE1_SCHSO|nr:unnamed protein product [Schistocephalus solidus]